jgi:AcrR family transcriptional regulator
VSAIAFYAVSYEVFVEKRHTVIESATRLSGSIGFDSTTTTTTLEIANEAAVKEPLIYNHLKGKDELFTHSLELVFNEYFARLDKLPKRTSTEFQKFANIMDYISGCLKAGISSGEFLKVPVSPTANRLVALLNGLLRQRVYQLKQTEDVKAATIDFCKRSLIGCSATQ